MKHLTAICAAILTAASANAEPYCADLLNSEGLPKKLARSAPIYSDQASGWIFTKDQLKDRYDMKSSSQALVTAVVEEFAKRDVALAIVIPPPRPIVAGQVLLDSAMGTERYDLKAAEGSFKKLVEGLAETGAIVPNLQEVALSDQDIRESFYFRRDTHWTTTGSAVSAIRLAELVKVTRPDLFPNAGDFSHSDLVESDAIEEKGSLAKIVRDVCKLDPKVEIAPAYDLTRASANGLLGDTSDGASIALVGSSFSDRYGRDHYRFGAALSRVFDAEVVNYSVSGGGPIGAIEAYVLSGALDRREHEFVVWEVPYTESFNSASFLRQLLGALELQNGDEIDSLVMKKPSKKTVVKVSDSSPLSGIEIVSQDRSHQDFRLEVHFEDGSKSKVALRRRNSVPVEMRTNSLFGNLKFYGSKIPREIVISTTGEATVAEVRLF